MNISLTITIIGTLSAIAIALERLTSIDVARTDQRKRQIIYTFAIFALVVSLLTQWLQFINATWIEAKEKKKQQGDIAFSLWAYTDGQLAHLRHLAVSHPFL